MSWLAGSPLVNAISTLKAALAEDFQTLKTGVPFEFTFEEFLSMFSVINSRCFKSEDSDCVIPMMDKITFSHKYSNCRPLFTPEGFELVATEDIARNKQLVIQSSETSKSSTFSDTGEAIAVSDVMMTFAFDQDDPWIP